MLYLTVVCGWRVVAPAGAGAGPVAGPAVVAPAGYLAAGNMACSALAACACAGVVALATNCATALAMHCAMGRPAVPSPIAFKWPIAVALVLVCQLVVPPGARQPKWVMAMHACMYVGLPLPAPCACLCAVANATLLRYGPLVCTGVVVALVAMVGPLLLYLPATVAGIALAYPLCASRASP